MFVYSVKSKQIKLFLLVAFVLVTAVCLFVLARDSRETAKDEEPVEVCEVIIPAEFDETYTKYNEIQKGQGFDLSAYAGMRVKRWTYSVKNYTGYENQNCIRINMLVYEGLVIGGDVCSIELNGFMHGFSMPKSDS